VFLTILAFLVVLGVLVFIHELGHFLAAKWAGIWVHRFSLGMGAPIKALSFKRGETEYAVSWLPLGGYVKMASREEEALSSSLEGAAPVEPVPPDRVFESKPVWKRMIVILAGVTMNFLFAYVVFAGLALWKGQTIDPETRVGRVIPEAIPEGGEALRSIQPGERIVRVDGDTMPSWNAIAGAIQNSPATTLVLTLGDGREIALDIHPDAIAERVGAINALVPWRPAVVDSAPEGMPAARAGIRAGDSIVAVAGQPVSSWGDMVAQVEPRPNATIPVSLLRGGELIELDVTTDTQSVADTGGTRRVIGMLGVRQRINVVHEQYSVGGALGAGWDATTESSGMIWRTVKGLLSGRVAGRELGGPILIGQLAGQTARLGLDAFLGFMALISVNLAILNLLPIPLLDGGQFLFLLAEGIMRRPLSLKLRERLATVGFVALILIMLLAFGNDFRRIFEGLAR
jgi:regulator of sigma E protease